MPPYRNHTCGERRAGQVGLRVRFSGWVHRKRDHGNLLFVDLRDNFGITQGVIDVSSPVFPTLEGLDNESVVTLTGTVVRRSEEHTSELQSLMRISYAVFCLKKKNNKHSTLQHGHTSNPPP